MRPKSKAAPSAKPRAILFTDIVGSTKYFASHGDEAGVQMLEQHNNALFPCVEDANGHIVKTIGDSIMAVFDHPVDALWAAWTLQRRAEELRCALCDEENFHIRVGVHYGLVTEKDDDMFGDVVNLAERVKSQANGDQIFVSRTLREMVRANLRFTFESAGLRELKGAPEPVELFQLVGAAAHSHPTRMPRWMRKVSLQTRRHKGLAAGIALAVLAAAAGLTWWVHVARSFSNRAVAVLPFRSMEGGADSRTEYLSLALPNEIDTQLTMNMAQVLLIRPLNLVERYKNNDWKLEEVAKELKVGTVVEGRIWHSGDDLRVNVDIIDARENRQLWSDSFDSPISDKLNLVNRMVPPVLGAMKSLVADQNAVTTAAAASSGKPPSQTPQFGTNNPQAYDLYLRGVSLQHPITEQNNASAVQVLEKAVDLDPNFARAQATLAQTYFTRYWWHFSSDALWLDKAEGAAERALSLDPQSAEAHYAMAATLEGKGQRADSMRQTLACVVADRHYVPGLTNLARYFFYMGDFDRALSTLDRIAENDPTQNIHPRKAVYLYFAGRLNESHKENEKAEQWPSIGVDDLTFIGATYIWLNDVNSAERVLHRLEQLHPSELGLARIRAWVYTARKQLPEARAQMKIMSGSSVWGDAQELAALYARQGDREQAITWLEKAVKLGGPSYAWYTSADYRLLRGDPRYEAVVKDLADEYQPLRPAFDEAFAELSK